MLVEITVIVKALQISHLDGIEYNKQWEQKMRSLKYVRGTVLSLILVGFLLLASFAIRSYERGDEYIMLEHADALALSYAFLFAVVSLLMVSVSLYLDKQLRRLVDYN